MGSIIANVGSMRRGKSTLAIIEINNHRRNNMSVFIIKPEADTRDGNIIKSVVVKDEICESVKADLVLKSGEMLPVKELIAANYDYIVCDEFHMLSPEVILQLDYIASKCDTNISLYGLVLSCKGVPFESAGYALGFANKIVKITSDDRKRREQMYHVRYENGIPCDIRDDSNAISAGDSEYEVVTREEFYTTYDRVYKDRWGL